MEVIINRRRYLQLESQPLIRVRLPANPTLDQMKVASRRLAWLNEHSKEQYPKDSAEEITAQGLWYALNKRKSLTKFTKEEEALLLQNIREELHETTHPPMAKEEDAPTQSEDSPAIDQRSPSPVQEAAGAAVTTDAIDGNKLQEEEGAPFIFKEKAVDIISSDFVIEDYHSSFEGLVEEMDLFSKYPQTDLESYLADLDHHLTEELCRRVSKRNGLNMWISVQVKYSHPFKELTEYESVDYLHSGKHLFLHGIHVFDKLEVVINAIRERIENFEGNATGLIFDEILSTHLKFAKFESRRG